MIGKENLVALLESSSGERSNPSRLVRHVYEGLGLADANGRRYLTPAGNPDWTKVLEARKRGGYLPEEFSLAELANVIIGEDWQRRMNPSNMAHAALLESRTPLLEAGTGVVTPTDFINVNAFTSVVTGLYEVSMLEGFNRPELAFADQLAPDEPTKVFGGSKSIGAGPIADAAEKRLPGMPTKRAGLQEKWMMKPETQETALSIEVLYETIYLDLTGDVTTQANDVGYRVKRRKATRITDCFIGSTAYTYNFKGTTYATYIAAGYYDNTFANELVHETNIELVRLKFRDMVDPITGERIVVTPNVVVIDEAKYRTWNAIAGVNADSTQYRDSGSAPLIRQAAPAYKGQYGTVISSPIIYERLLAAAADGGLALSATNAQKYWWMMDNGQGGAFRYSQNWPFRVQQATPTQMDMIDRGVVMYIKADERGEPYAKQPRLVVRSTN